MADMYCSYTLCRKIIDQPVLCHNTLTNRLYHDIECATLEIELAATMYGLHSDREMDLRERVLDITREEAFNLKRQ